jgi:hypothetical protein
VIWAARAMATIFWEELDNAFEKLCSVQKTARVPSEKMICKRFERLSLFGLDDGCDEKLCDG